MQKRQLKALAAAVAAAAIFAACTQKPAEQKTAQQPAAKADTSAMLAEVNGKAITADDFKGEAASLAMKNPYAIRALTDDKNKEIFLDNLVQQELVVQKALSMGLDKDPEVVKQLEKAKARLVLAMFLKKEVEDKSNITDKDVKDYFDQHKDELGAVRLSHILVATQPEADKVLAKLKAGEDFKKLAKQFSLDTKTKNSGGDLGYVKWTQLGSSSLKDAAFKLKTGEVSGIVQSQFGYHILKVTDKKPASDKDFETLKEPLKTILTAKKKNDLADAIIKDLRAKGKVTTKPENLKAVDLSSLVPEMHEMPARPNK